MLPLAIPAAGNEWWFAIAQETTRYTHAAVEVVDRGLRTALFALTSEDPERWSAPREDGRLAIPRSPSTRTAAPAWSRGLEIVEAHRGRHQVDDAFRVAREDEGRGGVGPVVGSLLGAFHGVDALPVEIVARLELGWVVNVLAQDLFDEVGDGMFTGGLDNQAGQLFHERYPG